MDIVRFVWASAALAVFLSVGLLYRNAPQLAEKFSAAAAVAAASNAEWTQTNIGDAPWEHHPVRDSVPADPIIRYKRAYYNELGNAEYELGFRQAFENSCESQSAAERLNDLANFWIPGEIPPKKEDQAYLLSAYRTAMTWLTQGIVRAQVRGSGGLALTDEPSPPAIQMVHDVLTAWDIRRDSGELRLTVDLVLYRWGKYHGKHIRAILIAVPQRAEADAAAAPPSSWKLTMVAARVLGIVYEDHIAIAPVVWRDGQDLTQFKVPPEPGYPDFDPTKAIPYPTVLMPGDTALAIIEKQNSQWRRYFAAEIGLKRAEAE